MPTAAEIVFHLRNTPAGGQSNREYGFSDRELLFAFGTARNKIIISRYFSQSGRQRDDITPQYQQDLGAVPLITCDITDTLDVKWGIPIKKVIIPKVIDLPRNKGVVFFGMIDKLTTISLTDTSYGQLNKYTRYPKRDAIWAEQIADTIYIYGDVENVPCYANIRVLADRPELVVRYDENGNEVEFDWDNDQYPIDTAIEQDCYNMVWATILQSINLPQGNENKEIKNTAT
jgi:hypothetical protein